MSSDTLELAVSESGVPRLGSVAAARALAPELSIVVPTYCERDNIVPLLGRLAPPLREVAWEVIFVDDDSPDGTPERIAEISRGEPRVRLIHRIGRRGLSSAVTEGLQSSTAPFVAVMDADLQHDEALLPEMLELLRTGEADVVVASRYTGGGGADGLDGRRLWMSRLATRVSRLLIGREISDPMSGFFMLTRPAFAGVVRGLSKEGFKILLDIFASAPAPLRVRELPYVFRKRLHGESKLDALVLWEFVMLLVDKALGGVVPARFVMFCLVGLSGVAVHFAVLSPLLWAGADFAPAQAAATLAAMTSNFAVNNLLTYRDRRLAGWRYVWGLMSFYLLCSLGLLANVGVAATLFHEAYSWWLSALAGILVGTVWNYAATSVLTWRR